MKAINRFLFRLKHEATGKRKAMVVPRPSMGTTDEAIWLRWMERHPEAEFTSYKGLFLMIPKK